MYIGYIYMSTILVYIHVLLVLWIIVGYTLGFIGFNEFNEFNGFIGFIGFIYYVIHWKVDSSLFIIVLKFAVLVRECKMLLSRE